MKKKGLIIILTVVLIAVAVLVMLNKRYLTTLRGEIADFVVSDTASVTRLFFADKNGHDVLLERTIDGWTVNKTYKAQQSLIDEMLYTIYKLKIRMPVSLASQDNVITRMSGTNTKVEIYQIVPRINLFNKIKLFPREKRTKVFYIGDVTQDNNGTYVVKEGADKAYIVHLTGFRGFISSRFSANPTDWRDHLIYGLKMSDISSLKLEFNNEPNKGYEIKELGRYNYSMNRLDGSPVDYDTIRILSLLTSFNDVRFESFLTDVSQHRRDSIINSPFLERLTITTKDGKTKSVTTYTMKINADAFGFTEDSWDDDPDHKYALISENNEFVLIQDFVFSKLLKPANYYEKSYIEPVEVIQYKELEEIQSR